MGSWMIVGKLNWLKHSKKIYINRKKIEWVEGFQHQQYGWSLAYFRWMGYRFSHFSGFLPSLAEDLFRFNPWIVPIINLSCRYAPNSMKVLQPKLHPNRLNSQTMACWLHFNPALSIAKFAKHSVFLYRTPKKKKRGRVKGEGPLLLILKL